LLTFSAREITDCVRPRNSFDPWTKPIAGRRLSPVACWQTALAYASKIRGNPVYNSAFSDRLQLERFGGAVAVASENSADGKIKALMSAVATTLPGQVQQTLPKIQGLPLQVLALRRYLRIGNSATEKWAWTEQQYAEFNLSYAAVELRQSIEAVKAKFEGDNPGYILKTAAKFRPLDRQIHNFCASAKVRDAAVLLGKAVLTEINSYADRIDDRAVGKFREFLRSYQFSKHDEPSVAVPGISDHGRAQAIDFVIYKDGKEIAGPSTAQIKSIWTGQGFGEKLNQAVRGSANLFKRDHLKVPFEPWHYDMRMDTESGRWSGELTFESLG
jgi:hypothetical protein